MVIGDVHGCRAELEELLGRVGLGEGDRLVSVGDLVARGPDSAGVLALVRGLGGLAVRGNHEQRVLDAWLARQRGEPEPRLRPHHSRLLEELDEAELSELAAMPLWLDLPDHDARVVHAGIVPGVAMEQQDPWALLHMRTLVNGAPSDRRGPTLWGAEYRARPHILFGHNAVDGLQLHPCATGLDTGCVYGGELCALVLPAACPLPPPAERRAWIVSVPARRAYVSY